MHSFVSHIVLILYFINHVLETATCKLQTHVLLQDPVAIPEDQLPLTLPDTDTFKPSGTPESPLANITEWVETTDPSTGLSAKRETSTMPQWAGSCWYYLRFVDPNNPGSPIDPEKEKYWMPVDLYIGGAEHAVLHLLYARFWHKVNISKLLWTYSCRKQSFLV